MHANSQCACSHSEAMKGSSSFRLLILSRLPASPIWAQLMLTDPAWGPRSLYFQDGDPFHRVRAYSLTGVQNTYFSLMILYAFLCAVQKKFSGSPRNIEVSYKIDIIQKTSINTVCQQCPRCQRYINGIKYYHMNIY
jgi:hypothetical protein